MSDTKYSSGDRFELKTDNHYTLRITHIWEDKYRYELVTQSGSHFRQADAYLDKYYNKINEMKHKTGDEFVDVANKDWKIEIVVLHDKNYSVRFNDPERSIELVSDDWIDEYYTKIESEEPKQVGGNHYSKLKIDPYEYSMVNGLNPLQMNAIKYITRYPFKNGIEDLEKAKHTIDRLIEYETKKENK